MMHAMEFSATLTIAAPPAAVWDALTRPEQMTRWMAEPQMALSIETTWAVGSPVTMQGRHPTKFVNQGTVLRFEPNTVLSYSHLSSLSRLPDRPESYSTLEFRLAPDGAGTSLALVASSPEGKAIHQHLAFYWRGTLQVLKRFVEGGTPGLSLLPR
jgi:uncharacterized protein YndB with AHSA1/START domain